MNTKAGSKRAALKARQEAQAKAERMNKILIIVAGILAVAVVAIVVLVVVNQRDSGGEEVSAQQTPPHATAEGGILAYPDAQLEEGAPHLVIYHDYQCPICKHGSDHYAKALEGLAEKGKIKLEYRNLAYLDGMLRNEWSRRSAEAATAADLIGKYLPYQDQIFAHQPEREGDGYSDELLRETIPNELGFTAEEKKKFQEYYDGRVTKDFVEKSTTYAMEAGLGGTPNYEVNGKQIILIAKQGFTLPGEEGPLLDALKDVAGS